MIVWDALRLVAYVISKTFWFIRFEGRENIPPSSAGAFLIAANHQSYIDPVWIVLPMRRRTRFMAVESAFKWSFIGPLIAYLGSFAVPDETSGSMRALREALRTLRDGAVLTIFPEGAREFADGKMLEFKPGAAGIAIHAGVPIVPVTVIGANRIWPRGPKYPRLFRRVTIVYHPAIAPAENADAETVTEDLRKIIATRPPVY
jgi:1-acyl-sn-glycerol-3-phosphate acyltransferase